MSVSDAELVEAIATLNDKTRRKELRWSAQPTGGDVLVSAYTAPYPGFPNRMLRITKYDQRRTRIPYSQPRGPQTHSPHKLEITDDDSRTIYVFPEVQGIADLFDSVEAQFENVDNLIKSLLSDRRS
jgi:hypothetical protein